MRAVCTKFRTTPARKNRERVMGSTNGAAYGVSPSREQMPGRKRQAVQIIDCRAGQGACGRFSGCDPHRRLLRFSLDYKVRMILQQMRHMRRRGTKEADPHPSI